MIKVSDYIIDFISNQGVKHVFMLSGGMAMHINDSLGKTNKLKYVCCIHEQACTFAAESYARITGNLGVVITTCGPAATNTLTGIACSWIESTPLLVITGQVKREDLAKSSDLRQSGVQEVNITSIATPITKYSVMITDPNMIRYELEKCVSLSKSGRPGPTLLDIPVDVQACMVDEYNLIGYIPELVDYSIDKEVLNEVVSLIQSSKRPVIYAGAGIQMSGASESFLKLINKLDIPVVVNWNCMDIIEEDHPLYVGRPGAVGQRAANFVIQNSDLLITIGTRLSPLQTGFNYKGYARNAKMIMVDIDNAELNKPNIYPYIKIQTDAKVFIESLLNHSELLKKDCTSWIEQCKDWNKKYTSLNPEWLKNENYVNSYYLLDEISSQMSAADVYIGGRAGTCVDAAIQAFKVKYGQRVYVTKGLSSMGNGLPAAIGGAFATNKKIVCVNGDGGFAMNIQELEVVMRENLPIKFFILDNAGYSTVQNTQINIFDSHFVGCNTESGVTLGNMCKIAEAYGLKTYQINNHHEMKSIINEVLTSEGPVLCNVKVDPLQPIVPRQANYKTQDGQMASRPLEDMRPLLDKEELDKIMISENNN